MPKRFVILAMQRTGSNMLVTALNQHPDVFCFGELLRRRMTRQIDELWMLDQIAEEFSSNSYRQAHPRAFVEACFATKSDCPFLGLKLMLAQNAEFLKDVIKDKSWKKILLSRENVLASFSSEKIAKLTGQGVVMRGEEIRRATVRFDRDEFETYASRRNSLYDKTITLLKRHASNFLHLEYREASRPSGVDSVFRHIGAPSMMESRPLTEKRNSSRILERFENPEDVLTYLKQINRPDWVEESL